MGLYDFGRKEGLPTRYLPNHTPVTYDVLEMGWIYAFLILLFSFLIVLPGFPKKQRTNICIRIFTSLLIGLLIMLSNFGQEWEVAKIHTRTPYKAGSAAEIDAVIKVKLGLRGPNITLKADEVPAELRGEEINYNERYYWSGEGWQQGRAGFGPFAGEIQQEYRRSQYKGLPIPILWIAEYFTFDGEGIRFARHYRQAGFYAHIMIWTAFPTWLLANVLFFMVVRYGAYFLMITGGLQLLANILWAGIRNPNPLVIPFEDETLTFQYGAHFWLCLINGLLCSLLGMIIWFMDLRYPDEISEFFGVDPLQNYEEHYYTSAELKEEEKKHKSSFRRQGEGGIELGAMNDGSSSSTNLVEDESPESNQQESIVVLKRRTSSRYQKSLFRRPDVAPRTKFLGQGGERSTIKEEDEDTPTYENLGTGTR